MDDLIKEFNQFAPKCTKCGEKMVWYVTAYYCYSCTKTEYDEDIDFNLKIL